LAESQDTQARVRQILIEMQPREAKLLLLRHAGLSYKELAEALNVAPGSVGSLLTQAKRTFARKYRQAFPEGVDDAY
jgi:RNA polymerase sigma-70 factor (ECF subfamily)